jgi:hypothetical protein
MFSARALRVRWFGGAAAGPPGFFSAKKAFCFFNFHRYFQVAARKARTAHQST